MDKNSVATDDFTNTEYFEKDICCARDGDDDNNKSDADPDDDIDDDNHGDDSKDDRARGICIGAGDDASDVKNDERYFNRTFENNKYLRSNENEQRASEWREHLQHVKDMLLTPDVTGSALAAGPRKKGVRPQKPFLTRTRRSVPGENPSDRSRSLGRHYEHETHSCLRSKDHESFGSELAVKDKEEKSTRAESPQVQQGHRRPRWKTNLKEPSSGIVRAESERNFMLALGESQETDQFPWQAETGDAKSKGRVRRKKRRKSICKSEVGNEVSHDLSCFMEDESQRHEVTRDGRVYIPPAQDSKKYEKISKATSLIPDHQTHNSNSFCLSTCSQSATKGAEELRRKMQPVRRERKIQTRSIAEEEKPSKNRRIRSQEKFEAGQEKVCLFVKIHALIEDINEVGKVLTEKVNTEGFLLLPGEKDVKRYNSCTYCTITTANKDLASMLQELLLNKRDEFTPLIDASFTEYEEASLKRESLQIKSNHLRAQAQCELRARSETVLSNHNQNLEDMKGNLNTAKAKLLELGHHKQTECEVAALEGKLLEMERQKREFENSLAIIRKKLETLLYGETFEKDIRYLRTQLDVECCRLQKPLPVYAARQDIIDLVTNNQVSVILGETGSGKSTQMVQYLMEAGLAQTGCIVCSQPRRLAAVSLATRVAEELASKIGQEVGYKAGSKSRHSDSSKIIFTTDLTLLNECLKDPDLKQFSCVIVDEAHERSLYTDLLLTMIKRCLPRRPDLRVVITSATIDPQVFVSFFGNCPVMSVSGRAFPVEVIWQDDDVEESDFDNYMVDAVTTAANIHKGKEAGDILVFLTSSMETEKSCKYFQQKMGPRTDYQCFQLHGKLPPEEQRKVFEPLGRGKRKIIFATNCAETSITIDGVRFVVDTGVAKEMRYDPKRNMNCLAITVISRSSADQRKGRAGRTAPGKCYRLYSKRSFQAMKPTGLAEILRTHLGQALLKLAEFGIGPEMYDFVESPSQEAIKRAFDSLVQLGALAEDGTITEDGKWIAKLPFDPKVGLLTLLGKKCNLLFDAVVLSAVMNAEGNVFFRGTSENQVEKNEKAKVKFSHSGGDFLTAFNVFKKWQSVPMKQKNKWCMENSLNSKVLNGINETVDETVHAISKEVKIVIQRTFSNLENAEEHLRRMIFKCYSSNLCHYLGLERAGYFAAEISRQVHLHPSSCMKVLAMTPEWVVFNQVIKTSREYITGVTPVDESWLGEDGQNPGFEIEDIRKKKVTNVFTQTAGSHAFFSLIGPRYCRLAEYEEDPSIDDSSIIAVEATRETGEIKVYSLEGDVVPFVSKIKETVENSVQDLTDDDMELVVGKEMSGLRVILGRGGEVKDLLMPDESRKVFICRPSPGITEASLRKKFSQAGKIVFCKKFSGGRNWGLMIFQTRQGAKKAEEMSRKDPFDVAEMERRAATKHQATLKARLRWCRRPLRGSGLVTVSPAYLASVSRLKSFHVENDLVKIRPDREKDDVFFITGLKSEAADKELVEDSLLTALGLRPGKKGIIEQVTLHRENVGKTSINELNKLKNDLTSKFQKCLKFSTVEVKVKMPQENSPFFFAEAFFTDPIEGINACRLLRKDCHLNGLPVEVVPDIYGSFIVHGRIVDVCRPEIDEVVAMLSEDQIRVELNPFNDDMMKVTVRALDMEDVVRARACLNEIFQGDVLECSALPELKYLLTTAGRAFLKQTEEDIGAFTCVDVRLCTISVHGSRSARRCMVKRIDKYITQLLSATSVKVCLKGGENPPGLMKTLIVRYGEDAEKFRNASGLQSVIVDYRRHILKVIGSEEMVKRALVSISELAEEVRQALKISKPEESSIDCVACLCPIEKGDLYRLEYCAHPYCRDCIKRQIDVAVADRCLPVVCGHDGCEQPLVWRDFKNLARQGAIKLSALAAAALSSFVMTKRDAARFCTTPDCPMVYRVTPEDQAAVFQCPECSVRICSACHSQAHEGVTCAMLRSAKRMEEDVQKWVARDPNRRKLCPACKSPIEKIGGCNKMRCDACRTIFCWLCCKICPSPETCYAHLKLRHGGIWNEADLLYDDE